jgi:hypothetical protein
MSLRKPLLPRVMADIYHGLKEVDLDCCCANGNGEREVDGIDLGFDSDMSVRAGYKTMSGLEPEPYIPWGPATEYVKEAREERLNTSVDTLEEAIEDMTYEERRRHHQYEIEYERAYLHPQSVVREWVDLLYDEKGRY